MESLKCSHAEANFLKEISQNFPHAEKNFHFYLVVLQINKLCLVVTKFVRNIYITERNNDKRKNDIKIGKIDLF